MSKLMYRVSMVNNITSHEIEKETKSSVFYNGLCERKNSQFQVWFDDLVDAVNFSKKRNDSAIQQAVKRLDSLRRNKEEISKQVTALSDEASIDLGVCESCERYFDYNNDAYSTDDDGNYFCSECTEALTVDLLKEKIEKEGK